jgi:hypothetical protein
MLTKDVRSTGATRHSALSAVLHYTSCLTILAFYGINIIAIVINASVVCGRGGPHDLPVIIDKVAVGILLTPLRD